MPDIVKIIYNNRDAFAPQPTPFIGVDYSTIFVGERWAQQEVMTIQGQITGCSFAGIVSGQRDILNHFNQSFQTLQIWQQTGAISGLVYQKDLVEVQSVEFAPNLMVGVLPYTITLSCYPSGLYSGAFGVLDPSDEWSFQESENAVLAATHTISCRAFTTSNGASNALVNARQWAFGRTGLSSVVSPIFISGVNPATFCLLSLNENIDRFNATYSLTENYTNDLAQTGYGVVRYTTDIQSGNNLITVRLNGSVEGCGGNLSGARDSFRRLDKAGTAAVSYQYTFGRTDLNATPLTRSITEDPFNARIDFDYLYNNDNSPDVSFDYTVSMNVGVNGAITASIQGTVRARQGSLPVKLAQTQAYANTVDLFALVVPFYVPFDVSSSTPLNPDPTTSGRGINQSDGTVTLNATWTNQEQVNSALDQFDYTMTFVNAVRKVDAKPALNGLGFYSLVDLGYANRASLSIGGTALVDSAYTSDQGITAVKQKALALLGQYGRAGALVLDVNEVTTDRFDEKVLSFTFQWSFDGTTVGPLFITSLTI